MYLKELPIVRMANPKPLDELFHFDALDADYISYCHALGIKNKIMIFYRSSSGYPLAISN
jgi:hypothetical protein